MREVIADARISKSYYVITAIVIINVLYCKVVLD